MVPFFSLAPKMTLMPSQDYLMLRVPAIDTWVVETAAAGLNFRPMQNGMVL